MVSAEFECGPVGVSMMQTSAAPGGPEMSPASAEASYLRGMAASVAASGASPYPHPEAILPHSHHPHMQVTLAEQSLVISARLFHVHRNRDLHVEKYEQV